MCVYSTAIDVADWFLIKSKMSHKKLQKLVYYAYAWTLTLLNDSVNQLDNKLFDARIEAWVHGAIIRSLYPYFADYGWSDIPQKTDVTEGVNHLNSITDVKDILNQVWNVYGDFTADELESINHNEAPWQKARIGLAPSEISHNQIKDIDIFEYYNSVE